MYFAVTVWSQDHLQMRSRAEDFMNANLNAGNYDFTGDTNCGATKIAFQP